LVERKKQLFIAVPFVAVFSAVAAVAQRGEKRKTKVAGIANVFLL
jgi:hypothetical protein